MTKREACMHGPRKPNQKHRRSTQHGCQNGSSAPLHSVLDCSRKTNDTSMLAPHNNNNDDDDNDDGHDNDHDDDDSDIDDQPGGA